MARLEPFRVTATFCFTPEHKGVAPHHTSPPRDPHEFAEFCATMIRRYAPPARVRRRITPPVGPSLSAGD
jgi:beta-xylosidase